LALTATTQFTSLRHVYASASEASGEAFAGAGPDDLLVLLYGRGAGAGISGILTVPLAGKSNTDDEGL
jgi:hypothetical protein